MSLGPVAHGAPRPPLLLAVTASGDLAYFAPEVERALASDLRHAGVAVVSVAVENALSVQIALDGRPGDRVVIAARVRGHQVDIEGAVESLDALVAELAMRVVPLCEEAPLVDAHRAEPARSLPRLKSVAVEPAPPVALQPAPRPQVPAPQPVPPELPAPQPQPQPSSQPGVPADPYGPDARVAEAPMEKPAFIRGRVVVHTLADPPDAPAGTGAIATQALYAMLQRQLHQSVVPLGAGLSSLPQVADEALRAQARFVVMGRLDSFALYSGPTGPIARLRIELSVVREGRYIVRRALYAETPLDAVNNAMAEGKRGRQLDPVYLAVLHALDQEVSELALALNADGTR